MNAKVNWFFRNSANIITFIGLNLSVILLWMVVFHREQMVAIFLLVSGVLLTDLLDGMVARRYNIVSKIGAAMDRFRDKVFQLTMFSFFVLDPRVDVWLKVAIGPLIVMEILLLAIWFLGVKKNMNVSAGIWGKTKMFLASMGILVLPVVIIAKEHGVVTPFFITHILFFFFTASLCFAVMSFKKHVVKYCEQV